jgi:hypothetical protein
MIRWRSRFLSRKQRGVLAAVDRLRMIERPDAAAGEVKSNPAMPPQNGARSSGRSEVAHSTRRNVRTTAGSTVPTIDCSFLCARNREARHLSSWLQATPAVVAGVRQVPPLVQIRLKGSRAGLRWRR